MITVEAPARLFVEFLRQARTTAGTADGRRPTLMGVGFELSSAAFEEEENGRTV